jgi:hypothetical protein
VIIPEGNISIERHVDRSMKKLRRLVSAGIEAVGFEVERDNMCMKIAMKALRLMLVTQCKVHLAREYMSRSLDRFPGI